MTKRFYLPPIWLCILISLGAAYFYMRGVTGIYIGEGPNLIVMLNVVESGSGNITGQYQELTLDNNGAITAHVFAVSGAASSGNMSLSAKENILSDTLTMSGTYNGFSIHLSFLGKDNTPTTDILNHSSLEAFQTLSNDLKERAQRILAAKRELQYRQEAAHLYFSEDAAKTNQNAKAIIAECRNKRLVGKLKNFVASVNCSNPKVLENYQTANYPYMDLISLMGTKRMEIAERIDAGKITESEGQLELLDMAKQMGDLERQRYANR